MTKVGISSPPTFSISSICSSFSVVHMKMAISTHNMVLVEMQKQRKRSERRRAWYKQIHTVSDTRRMLLCKYVARDHYVTRKPCMASPRPKGIKYSAEDGYRIS